MAATPGNYLKSVEIAPDSYGIEAVDKAILNILHPFYVVDVNGTPGVCNPDNIRMGYDSSDQSGDFKLLAYAPSLHPSKLGNSDFKKRYGLKYAYIAGAMAHGISSVELLKAAAGQHMIGFFGSAGLSLDELERTIVRLKRDLPDSPYGLNLVYSSNSPDLEFAVVNLFLKHKIRLISAAGYLKLSLPLLYYRITGIYQDSDGTVICPNKIIAKTSRVEIARQFLSPPPEKMISKLLEQRLITEQEAMLAKHIATVDDLTAEADSGGHTDNRSAISLLPSMIDLRDEIYEKHNYKILPCVGLAGGIATPLSVAAAFSMGADYVLTGSVNQACIESGTSEIAKEMLATAFQTDVAMAPSANMFERGIKVQVLKRGTMFPQRAAKLYDIYRNYEGVDQIPEKEKTEIEKNIFQNSLDSEWESTRLFFESFDPGQITLAEKDPKRKMGMLFRSYLGKSSKWAISGESSRKKDFQIWCGPSMGAFNEWTKDSFLALPENRSFQTISLNLLVGACTALRRQWIINSGLMLPPHIGKYRPKTFSQIQSILNNNR